MKEYNLQRFHQAQEGIFDEAFNEIKRAKKTSHWMWFIFPQIEGLGFSETSKKYAIRDIREAELYLQDPVLSKRLIEISKLLLNIEDKTAYEIFGSPDDMKLRSSMTLFASTPGAHPVFLDVLKKYFGGKMDEETIRIVEE